MKWKKKIEINNNFPDKLYLLLILFSTPGWAVSVLLFPFLPPSLSRIVGETWQGGGKARNPDESQFLPKQIRGFWKCKEILFLGIKDTIECYNGWVKKKANVASWGIWVQDVKACLPFQYLRELHRDKVSVRNLPQKTWSVAKKHTKNRQPDVSKKKTQKIAEKYIRNPVLS